jgi:flagellar hook-associated protein 2
MSSILPTSGTTSGTASSTSSAPTAESLATIGQGVVTSLGNQGTVTSTGLGSGLNINSIVQQLVSADGTPQQTLLTNQSNAINTQISAYGQIQAGVSAVEAALAGLSTPQQFQSTQATVADNTIASATTDSTATAGSYSLLVQQLATGSQLQSSAVASSSTVVGTGTLAIGVGSNTFNVAITSSNDTLAGIASAITSAGAGAGVSASLVTANDGVRLVINSATTGASNALTINETDGGTALASLTYSPTSTSTTQLTQLQGAQDAIVQLNGNAYNSASNVVTGLLTGVTLNLTAKSAASTPTTLTVAANPSAAQTAIQTFISSYNSLQQTISSLSSFNATSGTAGPLLGDPLLNNLVNQINEAMDSTATMPAGSPFNSLAQIGITANTDGTLSSNSTMLNSAFTNNFSAVAQLFSGAGGIATKLNNALTQFTQPDGVFATENSSLKQSLTNIGQETTALNQHLSNETATLLAQYNAMDALVQQLKQTGTQTQAQLSSIYYPGEANTPTP